MIKALLKRLLEKFINLKPFSFRIPTNKITLYRCNFHIEQEEDGRFTLTSFVDDLCPRKRKYESMKFVRWSIINQLYSIYGVRDSERGYLKDWVKYHTLIKKSGETYFRPCVYSRVKLIITHSLNIEDNSDE